MSLKKSMIKWKNHSSKKECLKFIYALRKTMFKGNIWNGSYNDKK